MKSNFEDFDWYRQPDLDPNLAGQLPDRFELLSAYIDGEITPSERQQVQQWLDTDPQTQQLYTQLLRLHQAVPHIPTPPPEISPQQLSERVLQRLDKRRKRLVFWGGVAVAALVAGIVSDLFLRSDSPTLQVVEVPQPVIEEVESDPLMIALNHPVIEIPPEPESVSSPPASPQASPPSAED